MGEKNLDLVKRFYDEVVNKGNLALLDELVSPDFVEHGELPGYPPPDRDGVKQFCGS